MESNRITTSNRNYVSIREFYIFNSRFGNDSDNEMGKVFYSFPEGLSPDKQLKEIGLCEAIVKFAETFNPSVPCEALHALKARHVFLQPEPGFWFIMVLTIPSVSRKGPEGVGDIEVTEYLDDEVQDNVFRAVMEGLYQKFVLYHGKFETVLEERGAESLKTELKKFFDSRIQKIDPNEVGIAGIFRGLQFLPLSRDVFLRVQSFINSFQVAHPQIKYVLLLQRDKLIWSGVDQGFIQVLYDYLVTDLLSQHFLIGADKQSTFGFILKRESHITLANTLGGVSPNRRSRNRNHSDDFHDADADAEDNSSFVTASSSTHTPNHNNTTKSPEKFHMLIYKAEQTYMSILIPGSVPFDPILISKMEAFLNLNFTPIAKQLTKASSSHGGNGGFVDSSHSSANKFLYFNSLNFAVKMSPGYQCDLEAYKLLADLKQDLSRMNENGEIIMKMVSENWMVAKVSNKREFYAIFNQKNSNLLEIDEEVRKLTEAHLTNIFFQE